MTNSIKPWRYSHIHRDEYSITELNSDGSEETIFYVEADEIYVKEIVQNHNILWTHE